MGQRCGSAAPQGGSGSTLGGRSGPRAGTFQHTQLLGTTVAEIAAEKAGIIFEGATVVLAAQPPEAAEVLLRHCAEVGATVAREGLEFGVVDRRTAVGGQFLSLQGLNARYEEVFLPVHGAHQAEALDPAAFEHQIGPEGIELSIRHAERIG